MFAAPPPGGYAGKVAGVAGTRASVEIRSGARLPLLGGAHDAGVVAAQDECADAAAGFAGGESDQALFEVAGHGVGVAWAGVPGGGVITW